MCVAPLVRQVHTLPQTCSNTQNLVHLCALCRLVSRLWAVCRLWPMHCVSIAHGMLYARLAISATISPSCAGLAGPASSAAPSSRREISRGSTGHVHVFP
jgi:hypothetical protein